MNPKQEIEQLTRELEYHNRQYYVLDDPKIDDYTYDHMLRRLEDLEKEYPQYASPLSPTKRVGGEAAFTEILRDFYQDNAYKAVREQVKSTAFLAYCGLTLDDMDAYR